MTCENALLLISGHLDHENTAEEEAQLRAHLEVCEQCREVLLAFEEINAGVADLREAVPADLRANVMEAIRAEAPVKKTKKRNPWAGLAVAAALVAVIGFGTLELPQPAKEGPAPAARTMAVPAEASLTYEVTQSNTTDVQALAEEFRADMAVTFQAIPEMEGCTIVTIDDYTTLYLLDGKDDAVELSRLYGLELFQPAAVDAEAAYIVLLQ